MKWNRLILVLDERDEAKYKV